MDNHSLFVIAAFITQLKANGAAAFLINRAQASKSPFFSWITKETPWATRIISFLFAAGTAAGIHGTYDITRGGTIVIPGAATALTALWSVTQNYAIQHSWGKLIEDKILPAANSLLGSFSGGPAPAGTGGQSATKQ